MLSAQGVSILLQYRAVAMVAQLVVGTDYPGTWQQFATVHRRSRRWIVASERVQVHTVHPSIVVLRAFVGKHQDGKAVAARVR
jgi:hypothetical protein